MGGTRDNLPLLFTCVALQLLSSGPQHCCCPGYVQRRASASGRQHLAPQDPSLLPAPLALPAHPRPSAGAGALVPPLLTDSGSSPASRCILKDLYKAAANLATFVLCRPLYSCPAAQRGKVPHHALDVTIRACVLLRV